MAMGRLACLSRLAWQHHVELGPRQLRRHQRLLEPFGVG